eukprot:206608-Amphidinium_carterae.1
MELKLWLGALACLVCVWAGDGESGGFNLGFHSAHIEPYIIGPAVDRSPEACEQACMDEKFCVAWE